MKKNKTNVDIVKDLMEFSRNGPMMQLFVIDALGKWSEEIASKSDEELTKAFGEGSFVNPIAWKRCAIECRDKLKEVYG
jgi:hypothetical protein